jgi:hypothetical protein
LHRLGYMRSMQSDLALRLNTYLLSPGRFAAGIAAVLRDAKRLRPNVVHAHWLLPNGFVAAVAAARFALRQADLLTANSAELREAVVRIGAQRARSGREHTEEALRHKFELIIYGTDPDALTSDDF